MGLYSVTILGNLEECRTEAEVLRDGQIVAIVYEASDGWHTTMIDTQLTQPESDFDKAINTARKTLSQYVNHSVKECFSNGVGSSALFLIAVAILASACKHPPSKIDSGNTAAPPLVSELSQALLGQRITVRGEILTFKCGPGISTEAGQAICLFEVPPAPGSDNPYAEMLENIVDATGTLRFYSDPALANRPELAPYQRGHYYFEAGTIQLKHLNYVAPVAASLAGPQLSKSLVGKRITIRGKLFSFKCGPGIALDDVEFVCIEDIHPISVSNPYPGMFGKRVEATGTLRFFHDSTPFDENVLPQRVQDHYYFQEETTRVRLVSK